jgi:hypothetical protein
MLSTINLSKDLIAKPLIERLSARVCQTNIKANSKNPQLFTEIKTTRRDKSITKRT